MRANSLLNDSEMFAMDFFSAAVVVQEWADDKLESEIDIVLDTVNKLRSLKPPTDTNERRPAFALCRGKDIAATVECYQSLAVSLSSVSSLKILTESDETPADCSTAVVNKDLTVYLELQGALDAQVELFSCMMTTVGGDRGQAHLPLQRWLRRRALAHHRRRRRRRHQLRATAPQAPRARRALLHRLVRLPLPPLQGEQERAGHRHRVLEEKDRWNRINLSSLDRFGCFFQCIHPCNGRTPTCLE